MNGFAKHCCLPSTKTGLLDKHNGGEEDVYDSGEEDDEDGFVKHEDDDRCEDVMITIWDDYHRV